VKSGRDVAVRIAVIVAVIAVVAFVPLVPVRGVIPMAGGSDRVSVELVSTQAMIVGSIGHFCRGSGGAKVQWWKGRYYYFPQWYSWIVGVAMLAAAGVGGCLIGRKLSKGPGAASPVAAAEGGPPAQAEE